MNATGDSSDSVPRRMAKLAEAAAILAIVCSALVFAALYFHAMATTSLWVDELYSIDRYTSHGPWFVITHYTEPNNHIFFNLINSLLPGSGSVVPLRARMWSFVFVAMTFAWMMWEFRRRAHWLGGALAIAVLAGNSEWLYLHLQARGYGLTALCALAMSITVLRFMETNRSRHLAVIGTCTVLGTWAVPTFVGFAAPLLLLLFLQKKDRHTFFTGALAAGGILLAYAPVLEPLLSQMGSYGATWGREYGTSAAIPRLLRTFLLHPSVTGIPFGDHAMQGLLLLLLLLPYGLWRSPNPLGQGVRLVLGAVAFFLLICLWLQTPLLRATSFVVLPIVFCAAHEVSHIANRVRPTIVLPLLCIVLALLQVQHTWDKTRSFHFIPIEDWQGTARYIEQTLPDEAPVYVSVGSEFFRKYLKRPVHISDAFDATAFAEGGVAAIETAFAPQDKALFGHMDGDAARWSLAARRPHTLWMQPPLSSHIQSIDTGGEGDVRVMLDRSRATCWLSESKQRAAGTRAELTVSLSPNCRYRSLILICPTNQGSPGYLRARMQVAGEDSRTIPTEDIGRCGDLVTILLGDRAVTKVSLRLEPSDEDSPFAISEMWAYPSSLKTP